MPTAHNLDVDGEAWRLPAQSGCAAVMSSVRRAAFFALLAVTLHQATAVRGHPTGIRARLALLLMHLIPIPTHYKVLVMTLSGQRF